MQNPVEESIQVEQDLLFDFCPQSRENIQESSQFQRETECTFTFERERNFPQEQRAPHTTRHTLQIRGSWVVQVAEGSNTPLSRFRCDSFKTFQVIRRKEETNGGELKCLGLILTFERPIKKSLTLLVQQHQREKLQSFWKILETKFIIQKGFYQIFKPIRRLGRGFTSTVISALNFVDKKTYAVKCYNKNGRGHHEQGQQRVVRQVVMQKQFRIWQSLNHQHLLKLTTAFETDHTIYMVTEQLHQTLHTFITRHGFVKRQKVKQLLHDILDAINYLHSKGIMHRDIKLDNIMLRKNHLNQGRLFPVIVDFGLAQFVEERPYFYVKCGTPGFTAPQIMAIPSRQKAQNYDQKCDIFSFGVVSYILLCKKMLFKGEKAEEVVQNNQKCEINIPKEIGESLGPITVDFLMRLLQKDPKKRMSAPEALAHPFFLPQEQAQKKWGSTTIQIADK